MADLGNEGLAELYRRAGSVSTVYADVTQDTSDPRRTKPLHQRTVREALAEAGAPEVDAAIIIDLLEEPPGVGGPVSRLLVVREGTVELNEVLSGDPLAELLVGYGPVPSLIPLLIQRPRDIRYVVAEVGRDGGEISLFRVSRPDPIAERDVRGDTEFITKVGAEDDFLANGRYQHHTEEIWKRNEAQVAEAIDEVVKDSGAELLVVTGDVRARQLLVDQLGQDLDAGRPELPATTRQVDASREELDAELHRSIAGILAAEEYDALQRLETGRNDGLAETDFAGVVRALQQAQVDTLLVTSGSTQMPTLIALDREPWVAVTSDEALGAGELGAVPAADALVRAAILTDAQVIVVSPTELPAGASAAAVLRWPTVPAHQGM
jgi:hypothetical protein